MQRARPRKSSSRYTATDALERAPLLVMAIDHERVVVDAAGAGFGDIELRPADVVGRDLSTLAQVPKEFVEQVETCLSGLMSTLTLRIGPVVLDAWLAPLRRRGGATEGAAVVLSDVTVRERSAVLTAMQLRLAQRIGEVDIHRLDTLGDVLSEALDEQLGEAAWSGDVPQSDVVEALSEARAITDSIIKTRLAASRLREEADALREMASTDPLTGLRNLREYERVMSQTPREPFSVLMIDVDGLKALNDSRGHEAGDSLLREAASAVASQLRGRDVLARIGGDEFAAVLFEAGPAVALSVASRMRQAVSALRLDHGPASVSIGWASAAAGMEPRQVSRAADEHLYEAKRGGRDQVHGGPVAPVRGVPADVAQETPSQT
jgi:diguanylate cyclase (GGDEF)-like protein